MLVEAKENHKLGPNL